MCNPLPPTCAEPAPQWQCRLRESDRDIEPRHSQGGQANSPGKGRIQALSLLPGWIEKAGRLGRQVIVYPVRGLAKELETEQRAGSLTCHPARWCSPRGKVTFWALGGKFWPRFTSHDIEIGSKLQRVCHRSCATMTTPYLRHIPAYSPWEDQGQKETNNRVRKVL